ncbi:MAG: tetratricopeptide repeat protein [Novosphingobium sp.]|nr:tetratricopeptide repeat protein [Novosphingobium sp.]
MKSDPALALSAAAAVEHAIAHHKAGRSGRAERLYRQALAEQPDHSEAHHNLGIILLQGGRIDAGLDHFRMALQNEPGRDLYWLSCARGLLIAGRPAEASALLVDGAAQGMSGPAFDALIAQAWDTLSAAEGLPVAPASGEIDANSVEQLANTLCGGGRFAEAASLLRDALERDPPQPDRLLLNLGNVLTELGSLDEAADAFEQAIRINPELAEAHYHLGSVLSENGRVGDGFAHLMRRAELVYGACDPPRAKKPEPGHKVKHDREQHDYLTAKGIVATGKAALFHLGDGRRIDGFAVNPANVTPDLIADWRAAEPKMILIEDFLTQEALEQLRAYCAESTIWRRIYDAGYIGATPPDGFACPLLAQIADEIAGLYSDILDGYPFQYLGAFKYDSELSTGTNTHADFSAVNVNFYIAPDEANLDPETGGMLIWDVEAKDEAELRRFNSNGPALSAHLKSRGAKATRVAHRANRAVIFKSALFHKTDDCDFKEGYLNKRINVSLLFGQWADDA